MSDFIYKPCDMLVDQSRYIGEDPVGYGCSNPGAYMDEQGYMYCTTCRDMLGNEPNRLTKPPWGPTTAEQWIARVEELKKSIYGKVIK